MTNLTKGVKMKFIKNTLSALLVVLSLSAMAGDGDAGSGGGPRMVANAKLANGNIEIPSSFILSANTREGVLSTDELHNRNMIKDGKLIVSNKDEFFLDVEMKDDVLLDMEMVRDALQKSNSSL